MAPPKVLLDIDPPVLADLFRIANFQEASPAPKLSPAVTSFIDIIISIFQAPSLDPPFPHEWAVDKHRFGEFISTTFAKIRHIRHDPRVIQEYDYRPDETPSKRVFARRGSTRATPEPIAERSAEIPQGLDDYLQRKLSPLEDSITRLGLAVENILAHVEATDANRQTAPPDGPRGEDIFYPQHHQQTARQDPTPGWNTRPSRFPDRQPRMNHGPNPNQRWPPTSGNPRVAPTVQPRDVPTDFRPQSEYPMNNGNVADHFGRDSTPASGLPTTKTEFRPKDIGFFEPNPEAPHVEIRDKVQVYHNVFSFTNRLRVKSQFHSPEILRNRMDECLLGKADTWYNQELSHLQRVGLHADTNGIHEWCQALENRFREPPRQSLIKLEKTTYTTQDVRDGKDPIAYLQNVFVLAQNAGMAFTDAQQVYLAYEHMDVHLRMTLPKPDQHTTISDFVQTVTELHRDWVERFKRRPSTREPPPRGDSYRPRNFRGGRGGRGQSSRDERRPRSDNRDRRESPQRKRGGRGRNRSRDRISDRPKGDYYRPPDRPEDRGYRYKEQRFVPEAKSNDKKDTSKAYNVEHATEDEDASSASNPYEDNYSDEILEEDSEDEDHVEANVVDIVPSNAQVATGTGRDYRVWHYAKAVMKLDLNKEVITAGLDTGCAMSIVDKEFLQANSNAAIKTLKVPIAVSGIGSRRFKSDEYVILDMFIDAKNSHGDSVVAHIRREVHIVQRLAAKLLLGMDIIGPEKMVIDADARLVTLKSHNSCTFPIDLEPLEFFNRTRRVRNTKNVTVEAHTVTWVPVDHRAKMIPEATYEFVPVYFSSTQYIEEKGGTYHHLVDHGFSAVQIRNDSDTPFDIPRHTTLGHVVNEVAETQCYQVDTEAHDLAALQKSSDHGTSAHKLKFRHGHVLPNGVTVFARTEQDKIALSEVVSEFPSVWQDTGETVEVAEEDMMRIPLVDDWQKTKLPTKIYPLSSKDKQVVDETFDKLHDQGRMQWSDQATPFGFPVFVVKKDGKSRVVVDIRGLNKITVPDAYPLPRQEDIIAAVRGARYISVVDATAFFHQWLVHPQDRPKLAVNTHRGQEFFKVAVMGFRNSPPYVQRQADRLFKDLPEVKVYIDDIVTRSETLEQHVVHLRRLFQRLVEKRISLKPTKAFIGFPNVTLLGNVVDAFGLSTTQDRIEAIKKLKFPATAKQLEHYVGLTGYLRSKVPHFARIVEPLQKRKTELLKQGPLKGPKRRNYAAKSTFTATQDESEAFSTLQTILTGPNFLIHHDPKRQLYVDLDASKEGFGVIAYHTNATMEDPLKPPNRNSVQPILFLSRLLTQAEKNYWPTEMEVACMVWTVRKLRHMLEGCQSPPIIYTDHASTAGIVNQTHLGSSATDKLNLRLIRASQYLSQFSLEIRHRTGKSNVIPDALSRLPRMQPSAPQEEIRDETFAHNVTVTSMSASLRRKIIRGYRDSHWQKILTAMEQPSAEEKVPHFFQEDGLLYFRDPSKQSRLCLPQSMEHWIFAQVHDDKAHQGFHRAYDELRDSVYVKGMARKLRSYIHHCPTCDHYQTRRQQARTPLNPIQTVSIPFHTIAIDFIVGLPLSRQGYNACLSCTCKFSKRIGLAPGDETNRAQDWAKILLALLSVMGWGLPSAIISDRDPKFLSAMWKEIFNKLNTKLWVTTAYHPQGDGQSERSNQTVEIALRFLAADNPELDWPEGLPMIMSTLNRAPNASTKLSPDEIVYGFKTRTVSSMLVAEPTMEVPWSIQRLVNRQEAQDALAHAQTIMKITRDRQWVFPDIQVGDEVNITLHQGYKLPGELNRKLSAQRTGPFRVLAKFNNACKLDIPQNWKIHDVISNVYLEKSRATGDPYGRPRADNTTGPVPQEGDTPEEQSWEVELILAHRTRKPARGKPHRQYLIRWKGYGPAFDSWYSKSQLSNARELLQEYHEAHGLN